MEIYKFRCKGCGSTKCEKVNENILRCIYCGEYEEIVFPKETKEKEIMKSKTEEQNFNKDEPKTSPSDQNFKETKTQKKDNLALISALEKLIICAVFGIIGIHKFMEGKVFIGVLYACTFGLFGIGWIIDCIKCVCRFLSESLKYLGGENG